MALVRRINFQILGVKGLENTGLYSCFMLYIYLELEYFLFVSLVELLLKMQYVSEIHRA